MTSPGWDVVGLGENSVDFVYRLPGGARRVSPGGQVATTLCTCAALGLRTAYLGTFGDDEHGTGLRRTLEERGVQTAAAPTRRARNRYACILVDESGDRTVFWQRDTALEVKPADLPHDLIVGAKLLHVDNQDEDAAAAAVRIARGANLHVTTDIDRVTPRTKALIDNATVPILAEHVPHALTGDFDPGRALRALRRDGHAMLCVTLGQRGAMLLCGDELHLSPAYPMTAVDTTGAGDVFRGAFIAGLLRGDAPAEILRFANAAAAVSCTRDGAIGGVPTREEIEKVLRS